MRFSTRWAISRDQVAGSASQRSGGRSSGTGRRRTAVVRVRPDLSRLDGRGIAGTDAHAKNYSILLVRGQTRLAPLYDVASSLPYDDMYRPRLRLAMKIASEYRVEAITGKHWRAFAKQNGLDPDRVVERIDALAGRLPEAFREAASADAVVELRSALPGRLAAAVAAHVTACRRRLAEG